MLAPSRYLGCVKDGLHTFDFEIDVIPYDEALRFQEDLDVREVVLTNHDQIVIFASWSAKFDQSMPFLLDGVESLGHKVQEGEDGELPKPPTLLRTTTKMA